MNHNNVIEEPDDRKEKEVEALGADLASEAQQDERAVANPQKMSMGLVAALSADGEFSDFKQYPEHPFSYFETSQVNVQLSGGHFHYEVTDFVLPGRDGFDLAISRRYDSGCANLADLYPDQFHGQLRTGTVDNNHYNKAHGLGYGWSFVLPSIEAIPYLDEGPEDDDMAVYFDYSLHLEDGRTLNMHRKEELFHDYKLKDVTIKTMRSADHYVEHPHTVPKLTKRYDIIIEYKNGHKDYFARDYYPGEIYYTRFSRRSETAYNFRLVAREDKFGNRIFFNLTDHGGMSVVDTWGRTIRLVKSGDTLTWNLPEQKTMVLWSSKIVTLVPNNLMIDNVQQMA